MKAGTIFHAEKETTNDNVLSDGKIVDSRANMKVASGTPVNKGIVVVSVNAISFMAYTAWS